jgi:hypothetical protein
MKSQTAIVDLPLKQKKGVSLKNETPFTMY